MLVTVSTLLAFLVLLGLPTFCEAQASVPVDGQALLERGVAAYQAGEAEQARRYLTEAREAGLQSAALAYNLGVVNFQLARYDSASREFLSLLGTPHQDLARYNLGLIALARENISDAREIFLSLSVTSNNDKIRNLSTRQLARLPGSAPEPEHIRGLGGLAMAGAGFDSNVDQLPDAVASGAGEAYTDGLLTLGSGFDGPPGSRGRWSWEGVGYHQHFPGEPDANLSLIEGSAGWEAPGLNMKVEAFTRHWWLASDRVESHYGARTSVWSQECGLLGRCYGELGLARVAGGPDYPEYDGWQYDLDAGFRKARWGECWDLSWACPWLIVRTSGSRATPPAFPLFASRLS